MLRTINQNRKRKGINGNLCARKKNPTNNASSAIDKLSDDLLINILSRLSLKEAARTSVLERRWRSFWCFAFDTLQLDYRHPGCDMDLLSYGVKRTTLEAWEKFEACVSSVLELRQDGYIKGLVISFLGPPPWIWKSHAIDSWVYFAVQKEVERFELHLNHYHNFPSLEMLLSHSPSPFRCVRTLRLVSLSIKDEVVNYFLASCPNLEHFSIVRCWDTKNVLVNDPPNLRVLEIYRCYYLQSLEVSAASLVSLAYGGSNNIRSVLLKKLPNVRELTIVDWSFVSFFSEPEKHSSYVDLDQLVKLVMNCVDFVYPSNFDPRVDLPQYRCLKQLDVKILTVAGQNLLFFASVIKASPQLCEFRIEMVYQQGSYYVRKIREAAKFEHRSLKVVEMAGCIGCSCEEELLRALVKNAPLIERVVIDTRSTFYDNYDLGFLISLRQIKPEEIGTITRSRSQHHARRLVSTFPHQIHTIVI